MLVSGIGVAESGIGLLSSLLEQLGTTMTMPRRTRTKPKRVDKPVRMSASRAGRLARKLQLGTNLKEYVTWPLPLGPAALIVCPMSVPLTQLPMLASEKSDLSTVP